MAGGRWAAAVITRQENRMICKRILVGTTAFLLLCVLAANDAGSADAKKRFSVRGLGTKTCSGFLEDRNLHPKESEEYANWFTGFLSAYNWLQPDTYDISRNYNAHGLLVYLDLYCGRNPKNRIIDAATTFVGAVYEKRQKSGS
ncbi:MAG TPA: hypothetical protein VLV76_16020 [Candidatus Acidoferrum sp.]|nr:hypothetical protein [Candidatus Acidoferrum sp.]